MPTAVQIKGGSDYTVRRPAIVSIRGRGRLSFCTRPYLYAAQPEIEVGMTNVISARTEQQCTLSDG